MYNWLTERCMDNRLNLLMYIYYCVGLLTGTQNKSLMYIHWLNIQKLQILEINASHTSSGWQQRRATVSRWLTLIHSSPGKPALSYWCILGTEASFEMVHWHKFESKSQVQGQRREEKREEKRRRKKRPLSILLFENGCVCVCVYAWVLHYSNSQEKQRTHLNSPVLPHIQNPFMPYGLLTSCIKAIHPHFNLCSYLHKLTMKNQLHLMGATSSVYLRFRTFSIEKKKKKKEHQCPD